MQSQVFNNSHILSITVTVLIMSLFSTSGLADITHADDVLVDGSICADGIGGAFCADGEDFSVGGGGQDAQLKVKHGNPVILLEDSTVNGVDWAIVVDGFPGPGIPANESFSIFNDESDTTPFIIQNGAADNLLYLDSTGIGINTNAPGEDLEIEGTNPVIRLDDTDASGLQMDIGVRTDRLEIEGNTGQDIVEIHAEAPAAAFGIDTNGLIGLGTASPTEAVDVVRDGAGRFQLSSFSSVATDAAQYIQRRARGTQAAATPVQSGDNIGLFSFRGMRPNGLFSGSQASMTVQAAENWGNAARGTNIKFGTTENGTSILSTVMEITHDKKVKINGTDLIVPDYVFEDEYELMPLDELKAYIQENKHLPNVASAEQVKREGVDLGGSQMALLEKIEELTLYTLKQHEQTQAQAQRLKDVEAQNEFLINRLAEMERKLASL